MITPFHQRIRVVPATEHDQARGVGKPAGYEPSGAPIRCQLWDHRRLVGVIPVTLDDMGHPSDVVYRPGEVEKVTRLAFVYGGKVFAYPLSEAVWISPSEPLHLALGHLKLLDRFGLNALKAGR